MRFYIVDCFAEGKYQGNHFFFVDMGDNTLAARCMMEDFVEDPATGSANGNLAGYLLKHDWFGSQDVQYLVVQGEDMGRKSVLHVHAAPTGWRLGHRGRRELLYCC